MSSITKAKISLYINYAGQIVLFSIVALIGLILYAYYIDCDPLMSGVVEKRDAVVSIFVLQEFAEFYGIPGIYACFVFHDGWKVGILGYLEFRIAKEL